MSVKKAHIKVYLQAKMTCIVVHHDSDGQVATPENLRQKNKKSLIFIAQKYSPLLICGGLNF
ncbi:hypothetical protein LBMAG20_16100 [Methylocystaceae bacterium]|nr:hypothetical protein LBMAG20_16100 [Methylocystaceae bacterium]